MKFLLAVRVELAVQKLQTFQPVQGPCLRAQVLMAAPAVPLMVGELSIA